VGKMDLTLSVVIKLENRARRYYGHIERMEEERLPKNVLHKEKQKRKTYESVKRILSPM
jgi:hypothetical protein